MDPFRLPSGEAVARLGQGAWQIGEDRARRAQELAALNLGLDLGLTLIDTAELYGDGASEELVAEAIAGRRDRTYVVSKVLPRNASRKGVLAACERSLKRLRTDYLDLYLLHWRESKPLADTLEAFVELANAGKIRHYGVSNLDVDDLTEALALPGGAGVVTNQVLYNLEHRGIEYDLLPWARERRMPVMAYSPLGSDERGRRRLLGNRALQEVAARRSATPARVALAWLLARDGVVTIPKASTAEHVRDNRAALDLRLAPEDLAELDDAFPPPSRKTSLAMI
ncbi:MAG TPA: aldo/keto reductase [Gammaproteobacteria bacterium]|nr:aldo/keto reductase [Gammaproteobacteria bacterium]